MLASSPGCLDQSPECFYVCLLGVRVRATLILEHGQCYGSQKKWCSVARLFAGCVRFNWMFAFLAFSDFKTCAVVFEYTTTAATPCKCSLAVAFSESTEGVFVWNIRGLTSSLSGAPIGAEPVHFVGRKLEHNFGLLHVCFYGWMCLCRDPRHDIGARHRQSTPWSQDRCITEHRAWAAFPRQLPTAVKTESYRVHQRHPCSSVLSVPPVLPLQSPRPCPLLPKRSQGESSLAWALAVSYSSMCAKEAPGHFALSFFVLTKIPTKIAA